MRQILFFALCALFVAHHVKGQCNFSPRPNTEPTGNVLDFDNGVTEDECCTFCQGTGGCTAFSYNPGFSACTAFAHTGFTDVDGVNSGELGGGPGPTTTTTTGPTPTGGQTTTTSTTTSTGNPGQCSYAPRQDEEPTGEVLEFNGGIEIDECCTWCQTESACTAFGYSPDFSVCTLWRHTGFQAAPGVVGAEKGTSGTTAPPQTTTTSTSPRPTDPTATTQSTTTQNPDVEFDCNGRNDGMYPHPADCAQFVGCRNGQATFYKCPEPLLFDPIMETCNLPEETNCRIHCIDTPDGLHSHPYYCDYFMICNSGGLEVYRCPPPLLFHKDRLQCTFPEDVTC